MDTLLFLAQNADPGATGAGIGLGMFLLFAVISLIGLVLWIWALIDALRNPALSDTQRVVWVLVIFFTQILGAIVYFAVGRKSSRSTLPG